MAQPDAALKRALKSRAQTLEAAVRVGGAGVTEPVLHSLREALERHELVKVRFTGMKAERHTLAPEMARLTQSHLIQELGNVAVFYRPGAE